MDSFDDFELKPLSEGLGFHKKPLSLKDNVKKSNLVEQSLKKDPPAKPPERLLSFQKDALKEHSTTYEDLLSSLSEPRKSVVVESIEKSNEPEKPRVFAEDVQLSEALPRKESRPQFHMEPELGPPAVSEAFIHQPEIKNPQAPLAPPQPETDLFKAPKPKVDTDLTRRGGHNSPSGVKLVAASLSIRSLVLDMLVVLAISLIFLLSLLWVTKVDLTSVWFSSRYDMATQLSIGILYLAVFQMYVVISRSFFGRSMGEWTFDYQVGDEEQQKRAFYPVRVLFRTLLVMVTGFVLLPVLSLLFRVDLAGKLSGIRLYEQKI